MASSGPGDPAVSRQGVALRLEGLPLCCTVSFLAQVRCPAPQSWAGGHHPLRRGRPAACSCPGVCTAGQAGLGNAGPCAGCSPLEGVLCRSQSPTRGSQYCKPGWEAARAWGFLGNSLLCFFPFKASSEAFGLQAPKHRLSGICRALEFQTQP